MSWIEEKKRKLESNNKTADESNLTEKIKLLQKHQALQVKQRQNLLNLNQVAKLPTDDSTTYLCLSKDYGTILNH